MTPTEKKEVEEIDGLEQAMKTSIIWGALFIGVILFSNLILDSISKKFDLSPALSGVVLLILVQLSLIIFYLRKIANKQD